MACTRSPIITRKVKRDEFPFATYVFVADQLNLPTGLTTATLTGQTKSGVTFESQKDVLNIPDSARAFGTLKTKMGNVSFYKVARQDRGGRTRRRSSRSSNTPVVAGIREPGGPRHRQGQGGLHADPGGGGTRGEQWRPARRRCVPWSQSIGPTPQTSRAKIPVRLKHSMHDFLSCLSRASSRLRLRSDRQRSSVRPRHDEMRHGPPACGSGLASSSCPIPLGSSSPICGSPMHLWTA